jgi:hypothetical protein
VASAHSPSPQLLKALRVIRPAWRADRPHLSKSLSDCFRENPSATQVPSSSERVIFPFWSLSMSLNTSSDCARDGLKPAIGCKARDAVRPPPRRAIALNVESPVIGRRLPPLPPRGGASSEESRMRVWMTGVESRCSAPGLGPGLHRLGAEATETPTTGWECAAVGVRGRLAAMNPGAAAVAPSGYFPARPAAETEAPRMLGSLSALRLAGGTALAGPSELIDRARRENRRPAAGAEFPAWLSEANSAERESAPGTGRALEVCGLAAGGPYAVNGEAMFHDVCSLAAWPTVLVAAAYRNMRSRAGCI